MSIIFKMLKYLKNYSNLIKGVIIIALVIILVVQSVCLINYKSSYEEEKKSGSAIQVELDASIKQNEELEKQLSEQKQLVSEKDQVIAEKEQIIDGQTITIHNLEQIISEKDTQIQELEKTIKELNATIKDLKASISKGTTSSSTLSGYEQTRQVWNHLRGLGLNEYVCAGIIGNIMAEVGGQTLDISAWPQCNGNGYYGICQWAGSRKQRLLNDFGTTLEDQLRFLSVELFEVIPKGNSFYNMQDEKEAALYFAKYYERCGTGSYSVRQTNATKALEYFTK